MFNCSHGKHLKSVNNNENNRDDDDDDADDDKHREEDDDKKSPMPNKSRRFIEYRVITMITVMYEILYWKPLKHKNDGISKTIIDILSAEYF